MTPKEMTKHIKGIADSARLEGMLDAIIFLCTREDVPLEALRALREHVQKMEKEMKQ